MRILGIDPGLIRTGYGLIEAKDRFNMNILEAGIVRTNAGDNISKRLREIFCNVQDIVKEYKPAVVVIEKLYSHYKHPTTSILMGHARGVVCLVAGLENIKLVNFAATKIKKSVTGNGQATKVQVQRMVKNLLKLNKLPNPVDISDALALAIGYVNMEM